MSRTLTSILRNLSEADPIAAGNLVDFEEKEAGPSRYAVTQNIHPAMDEPPDDMGAAPYDGAPMPGGTGGAPDPAMGGMPPPEGQLQDMNSAPPPPPPGGQPPPMQESQLDEFFPGFQIPGFPGGFPGMPNGGRGGFRSWGGLPPRGGNNGYQQPNYGYQQPNYGQQPYPGYGQQGGYGPRTGYGQQGQQGPGPGGSGYLPPNSPPQNDPSRQRRPGGGGQYQPAPSREMPADVADMLKIPTYNDKLERTGYDTINGPVAAKSTAPAGKGNRIAGVDSEHGMQNPNAVQGPGVKSAPGATKANATDDNRGKTGKELNDKYGDMSDFSSRYNLWQNQPISKTLQNLPYGIGPTLGSAASAGASAVNAFADFPSLKQYGSEAQKKNASTPPASPPTPPPTPAPAEPAIKTALKDSVMKDNFDLFLDELLRVDEAPGDSTADLNRQELARVTGGAPHTPTYQGYRAPTYDYYSGGQGHRFDGSNGPSATAPTGGGNSARAGRTGGGAPAGGDAPAGGGGSRPAPRQASGGGRMAAAGLGPNLDMPSYDSNLNKKPTGLGTPGVGAAPAPTPTAAGGMGNAAVSGFAGGARSVSPDMLTGSGAAAMYDPGRKAPAAAKPAQTANSWWNPGNIFPSSRATASTGPANKPPAGSAAPAPTREPNMVPGGALKTGSAPTPTTPTPVRPTGLVPGGVLGPNPGGVRGGPPAGQPSQQPQPTGPTVRNGGGLVPGGAMGPNPGGVRGGPPAGQPSQPQPSGPTVTSNPGSAPPTKGLDLNWDMRWKDYTAINESEIKKRR